MKTIALVLCDACDKAVHNVNENGVREGHWHRLPVFCAECEAKVAQAVRLLTSGMVMAPRVDR